MKQLTMLRKAILTLAVILCQVIVFAQDNGGGAVTTTTTKPVTTTEKTTTTTEWYVQPWVWAAGAAVFILIMVALLRGRKNTDKVSVTKTVRTENN